MLPFFEPPLLETYWSPKINHRTGNIKWVISCNNLVEEYIKIVVADYFITFLLKIHLRNWKGDQICQFLHPVNTHTTSSSPPCTYTLCKKIKRERNWCFSPSAHYVMVLYFHLFYIYSNRLRGYKTKHTEPYCRLYTPMWLYLLQIYLKITLSC